MKIAIIAACLSFFSPAAIASCNVNSIPIQFGSYDVFSASVTTSTGSITVSCTPDGTPYTIAIQRGFGTIAQRKMRLSGGIAQLNYNIYTDPTYTTIWGDGTGTSAMISGQTNATVTAYGEVTAGQDVPAGSYSDTLTILVSY